MDKTIIKKGLIVIALIAVSIFIGIATFWGSILLIFMGMTHWAYALVGVNLGIIVYSWLMFALKNKRKLISKIAGIYFLVVLLSAGGVEVYNQIDERVPVVGDGSVILEDYIPFEEGSKLITLNNEASLKLTDNLPRVDGATALFPVYSAFVQAVYPKADYSVFKNRSWLLSLNDEETNVSELASENKIPYFRCTKTNDAYVRLINKEADIIFVAGPSDSQLEAAKDLGVKMKFTPIGKEAFVFFVNSKNEVNNLTIEEIQKIYSGEITNWKEVGGKNDSIRAFQRPKNSGSQTALEKLMGEKLIMKPIKENVVDGMGGIIDKTASYKNYKNAIGYSFRYFSTQMVKNNEIKHLSLNGVMPTKDTIRDGSYPISNNFYAVTLEENENPNVERFIEWILSDEGQYIVEETGYVGI